MVTTGDEQRINDTTQPVLFIAGEGDQRPECERLIRSMNNDQGKKNNNDPRSFGNTDGDEGIHKEVAEVTEEGDGGERGCGLQGTEDGWDECAGLAGQRAGCGLDGDDHHKDTTTRRDEGIHKEVAEVTEGGDGGKNSEFRIQNLEANRSVALPKSSAFCLPSSVFSSHCSMYLLGFRSDVSALMAACDIIVLPAPAEPFGLVLIEAMALGKPVIAAAAGGPLEIVADGETGLLFEPGNAGSLAGAMGRLLADPDLRRRMGIAGRRRYAQKFTARRMAEKMQEVYQGVTG
jgi:glycosyltransferase involved in cell wall biosynthesis